MRGCLEEILACALRNHQDSMTPLKDPLFEGRQETTAPFESKGNLRDKGKVDVLARYGSPGGNEARIAPINLGEPRKIAGTPQPRPRRRERL